MHAQRVLMRQQSGRSSYIERYWRCWPSGRRIRSIVQLAVLGVGVGLFCPATLAKEQPAPCPEDTEPVPVAGSDGECRCQDLAPRPPPKRIAPAPKKKASKPLAAKQSVAKAAPKKRIFKKKEDPTFPCPPPLAKAPEKAPKRAAAPPKTGVAPVLPPQPPAPLALPPSPVLAQPRVPVLDLPAAEDASPVLAAAPMMDRGPEYFSYGEMHYQNFTDDSADDGRVDDLHLHRLVGGARYPFTPRVRFAAELELEDAWSSEVGDDEAHLHLEQAYVETDLPAQTKLRAGIVLTPVGILNEVHRPTMFYGVERNPVETEILPTTWFEPGVSLSGPLGPVLAYDVAVQSGLRTPGDGEPRQYDFRRRSRR